MHGSEDTLMKKIILDVDTGSDDAVAIMTAVLSPAVELTALCTVWGNLSVEKTTFNTLAVSEALNAHVPVYKGAHTAMVKYLTPNRSLEQRDYHPIKINGKELRIHTETLEGIPSPKGIAQNLPAPLFYVEYLKNAASPVTLVAVGPLTNLGLALTMDPSIVKNIERIVIMGGSCDIANSSLCSEANIWHDPEAAQKVINSGAEILLVPLDATHAAALNLDDCAKLESLGSFAGNFSASLIRSRIEYENALFHKPINKTAVHDALAVCAVIDETVLKDVRAVHAEIGLNDYGEGSVLIDCRRKSSKKNIRFAYAADHDKFISMLCKIFMQKKEL